MENKFKNAYLSIDSSYYFKESGLNEKKIIDSKIKLFNEINEEDKNKVDVLKSIISQYIEKVFPEQKVQDIFSISHYLSKYFCKTKNINKNSIEKYINYFFNKRVSITYSNTFILNIEGMKNIGNIISYIYSRLDYYKIKNKFELNYIIKKNGDSINVLTDFYNYCADKNLPPNEENKSIFWFNNRKKYNLPGELIFLINLFNKITIFDFDINFQDDTFNNELLKYFALVLMNLDLFLNKLKYFKLNFIHEKFQSAYYSQYHQQILNKISPDSLKINTVKENDTLYLRKWNFENNFMLEEYRNIELIKKRKINEINEEKEFEDFTIIQEKKTDTFNNYYLRNNESFIVNKDYEYNNFYNSIELYDPNKTFCEDNLSNRSTINFKSCNTFNNINYNDKLNPKNINYKNIVERYHYTFEIIFILFKYISNYSLDNIDLIMNDSYTPELIYYFKKFFKIDIKKEDYYFHILDLYSNKLNTIRSLNFEIDSFDLCSYELILKILNNNTRIKDLKISFFTCDINYFPYTLEKSYLFYTQDQLSIKNSEFNENHLLEYFYPEFKNNLLFLLFLIKKKTLNKLGLNFDIPILIQKKENYMMTILKFLLNIFIYLNEPSCKVNIVTLLSPSTILDGNLMNNIDKIFEEIDYNVKNMYLYELYVQFTMYKIPHIKNIISINLIILNIGDLDIITFESVVNYLNSYKFANLSLLRQIKIKLVKNIYCLSSKLKIILRTLFNIKLKNLKKLGLYSNIILKNEKECYFILKILNDNWISSYTLIFNERSQEMFKNYANNNNITYLVPHNLENEIIGPEKNNNRNISTNTDDTVYWYLKYIFNNRFYYISKNFKAQKYYIYNILKYLYFIKKIDIFYDIISDEAEKKKK